MTGSAVSDDGLRGWALLRADGTIVAADEAFSRLVGLALEGTPPGPPWRDVLTPDSAKTIHNIERGGQYGLPWRGTLRVRTPGGSLELDAEGTGVARAVLLRVTEAPGEVARPPETTSRATHGDPQTAEAEPPALGTILDELGANLVLILRRTTGGGLTVTRALPGPIAGLEEGVSWGEPDAAERAVIHSGEPALDGALMVRRGDASPLAHLPAYGMRSVLRVPLYDGAEVVGLALAYASRPSAFDLDDARLLERATRHLGAGLSASAVTDDAAPTEPSPVPARFHRPTALAEVMAGIAHELNNPLAAVAGYAQALRSLPPAELLHALDVIEAEALRAGRVVSDLLAFTQGEPPRRRSVDLNGIVRRLIEDHGAELQALGIGVELHLSPLPLVPADADQLARALAHLLANAQQAMREAGGTLRVRSGVEDEHARIEVEDTGPAIPPDLLDHVFDPFVTTRGIEGGPGLALPAVLGIAAGHGGRAWVEAPVEGGARFVLELPLAGATAPPDGESTDAPSIEEAPPAGPPAAPRVLVVDDEDSIRALATQVLATFGYDASTAPSGEAALALLEAGTFDAIITDIRMPGMGGIAFYREVARRWPVLARSVVIMTGDLENEAVAGLVREAGLQALEKPFRLERLREALTLALAPPEG